MEGEVGLLPLDTHPTTLPALDTRPSTLVSVVKSFC